jgi:hypothetical protein
MTKYKLKNNVGIPADDSINSQRNMPGSLLTLSEVDIISEYWTGKGSGRKESWPTLRFYPGHWPGIAEEHHKKRSQKRLSPG